MIRSSAAPTVTGLDSGNAGRASVTGSVTGGPAAAGVTGNSDGRPVTDLEAAVQLVPLSAAERIGMTAREIWAPFARLGHRLMNPMTMAEHKAHVKTQSWVPPDLTGRWRQLITVGGIVFHLGIGRPVKAICKTVDSCADYPLAFTGLLLFILAFVLILIH